MEKILKTNWKKVDSLKDSDIDYTDSPEVTEEMLKEMTFRESIKKGIFIKLDTELIEFFKQYSKHYQTKINRVLLAYKNAFERRRLKR